MAGKKGTQKSLYQAVVSAAIGGGKQAETPYRQSFSSPTTSSSFPSTTSNGSRNRSYTYNPSRPLPPSGDEQYKIIFPYDAQLSDELTTRPGDIVVVSRLFRQAPTTPSMWIKGTLGQESGYFFAAFATNQFDRELAPAPTRNPNGHEVSYFDHALYAKDKPGEDLECVICKNLSSNPHQSKCCGHTMCLGCGEKWRNRSDSCPSCRAVPLNMVEDPRSKRYVHSLDIFCSNFPEGCDWEGTVSGLKDHLGRTCRFKLVPCSQGECRARVRREEMQRHQLWECSERRMPCPRCSLQGREGQDGTGLPEPLTFSFIAREHYRVCPEWPMRCPNDTLCGASNLTRATLPAHLDRDCPEQPIPCPFAEVGCEVRARRREMEDHVRSATKHHLGILMADHARAKTEHARTVDGLTGEVSVLRQENSELKSQVLYLAESVQSLQDSVEQLRMSASTVADGQ